MGAAHQIIQGDLEAVRQTNQIVKAGLLLPFFKPLVLPQRGLGSVGHLLLGHAGLMTEKKQPLGERHKNHLDMTN